MAGLVNPYFRMRYSMGLGGSQAICWPCGPNSLRPRQDKSLHERTNSRMSGALKLEFAAMSAPLRGVLVMFCEEGLKFGATSQTILQPCGDLVTRAAAA